MGDALSDDGLLAGLALGEAQATAAFIRRFQRQVFGVALSFVGDPVNAEDVAQQAFERAWRHARMYDPRRGSVQAWLLTITRNCAIDQLRSRRRVTSESWEVTGELESVTRGPEDEAVAEDSARALRRALRDLPAEQARALFLAAFRGLTSPEIAETEGIPLGTAKTRIRAAMLKLRAALPAPEVES
ncbi:MAG TPA: sigma-70 family RNA polymerase sigma factor [Acidimicrobiales bacterium]|nr:sigma-70 family RNA polymerase sigma factor [Acidimicrobiales bacterium]